jgi:hypothetical protein
MKASEAARARVEIAIIAPQRAMHDRQAIGEHGGGALEESERGQRLEIGRIAVEILIIGRDGHAEALGSKGRPS